MRRLSGPSIAVRASHGAGWLRADLGETVQVVPRGDGAAVSRPAEFETELHRWSGRLSRSRALVVARRWLLVGLIVALVPAVIILVTGGSRPWWLFAVVLVAPLAGLIAVARPPSPARTAQVLDRRLGLADRLTTALELRSAPVAPTGLGELVVDEASSALGHSLDSARATGRRSPRELAWLLAAAVALVLVIAVPRGGSTATQTSTRASTGPGAVAGGGAAAATRSGGATGRGTTIPSATPLPRPIAPKQIFGDGGRHYDPSADPYGGGDLGDRFHVKQQAAKPAGAPSGLAGVGAPGAAQPGAAEASGSSSSNTPAPSGGGAGQSRLPTPAGGATGQPGSGSPLAAAAAGGTAGGARAQRGAGAAGGAPQAAPGARGAASGKQTGSGGSSGGETAGGVRAARSHGVGLVPALGGSGAGLPLQGSLAGSRAGRSGSNGAISSKANGGGGYARGVQSSGGAGGAGGSGVNLPVLAPTFNSSSQLGPGLLQRYFGVTNRLAFKSW